MIQSLLEQSSRFIDDLYSNVQSQDADILNSICEANHSLLFIVHHLRIKRCDSLEEFYRKWRKHPSFPNRKFIMNILMLVQFGYNSKLCKQLLNNILNLEGNSNQYLNLIPKDIFIEIKKYNPLTYQRKEKKIQNRMEEEGVIQNIENCTRGYAQVTLVIATFMQFGLVKQSHEQAWSRIMGIVGRYNLSCAKAINMVLTKTIQHLDVTNQEEILLMVSHIPFENFISFLKNKIYTPQEGGTVDLVLVGSIQYLSAHTTNELFERGQYFYSPKYLKLIRLLLQRNIYSIHEFLPHFFYITSSHIEQIEQQKLIVAKDKVNGAFSQNLSLNPQQQKGYKRQQIILMGQAFHCFKLALMSQFIQSNDFIAFKELYQTITEDSCKIDFVIFMPVVRQFCLLLQWVIDPLYQGICYGKFFKGKKQVHHKENGYFKQHTEVSDALFQDITQILQYLQLNIGFHVKTLVKVVRLFKMILHRNYFKVDWTHLIRFKASMKSTIQLYLLPALTLQEQNCSLAFQMYSLLTQFTQQQRFQMYHYYLNEVMFNNPYLAKLFESAIQSQFKILNKLNLKNLQVYNIQARSLSKIQHNQFLQGSFYLLKRALSQIYENESQCYSKVVGKSTGLSWDGMAFLTLNYLASNKEKLMESKITNALLTRFIYNLYQNCKELDMSFFVRMVLKLMLSQSHRDQFECFHLALRLFKHILDHAFPHLVDYDSMKLRLQFLTYGYHLKLELLDQVQQFNQHNTIRERLISVLSSKILSSDNTHHSLLYCFMRVTSARINLITQSKQSTSQSAYLIDECMDFMRTLCRFFAYEMDRERERSHDRSISASSVSDSELADLIRGEAKVPMPFACLILRALKKHELYNSKIHELPQLKKYWEKVHTQPILFQRFEKLDQVRAGRINSFLHSDFYFFFWTSDIENIYQLQHKYRERAEQLRKIISQGDIFNVSANQLDKTNKQRYIQTYNMIEREREDMRYYYQKFNITVHVISNKNTNEKVNKFSIPSAFTVKDDVDFSDFINLFFLHCLLPRMSVDETQAIFCSKLLYKVIKENKLSSNKSLILIFALIQAAASFIPFSTQRQVRCIAIFTTDLLRLFSSWHKSEEISLTLQTQIGMQKFNDKRYDKLKDFLMNFEEKIISMLIVQNSDSFVIRNCMLFIERNEHLPLSANQSERIIKYMNGLQLQPKEKNEKTEFFIRSVGRVIEARSTKLGTFSKFNYEEEMKKYSMFSNGVPPAVADKPKSRIYQQEQGKKGRGGKEHNFKY